LGRCDPALIGTSQVTKRITKTVSTQGTSTSRIAPATPPLDHELFDQLVRVVEGGRSVEALEESGAVPSEWPTYKELLPTGPNAANRDAWHHRALEALQNTDVVFADPDNGLSRSTKSDRLHKYAFAAELAGYAQRGQSLVVYQHADRSTKASEQANRRLAELSKGVNQEPIGAIIGRRGTCRFFLVTGTNQHGKRLRVALETFVERWQRHAELILPS
jgi:hypothetical protein